MGLGVAGGGGSGGSAVAATPTVNAQSASYTLALADAASTTVTLNNASANNLTVPTNASVAIPVGSVIYVSQVGAGATTIVAAGGVTLDALNGNLVLAGVYGLARLQKIATNEWLVAIYGTVPGPRELARAVGPTTAQTGITTVTDVSQLTISFTVASYPVEVEAFLPWVVASAAGQANGDMQITDNANTIKAYGLVSMYAASAFSAPGRAVERIVTPGSYVRKVRIERVTGTGTIGVAAAGSEATTDGYIRAIEVPT